ncbi:MAG: hypothetical protein JNK17_05915 [Hydrogenophaga sp.]|nr:hypothetical protein [Hydrogenophaga sp.]
MEPLPPKPTPDELPEGRLQGRQRFADLVRQALACAARERWPHLVLSDPDFSDWPLGERGVIESLNAWAGKGRRLQLLARDYGRLREQCPRLVQWRVTWSHIVEAQACRQTSGGEPPSAIWSPTWTLERIDIEHGVMIASRESARRAALQERLQACWQLGAPSFPATTLGL